MKKILKRGMSGLLAVLMAFTVLAGFGTTTAFAASETAESYMISFPRDGDAAQIYSEDAWGHSAKTYMNGWTTGSSNYTTLHCMDSFDGKVSGCRMIPSRPLPAQRSHRTLSSSKSVTDWWILSPIGCIWPPTPMESG